MADADHVSMPVPGSDGLDDDLLIDDGGLLLPPGSTTTTDELPPLPPSPLPSLPELSSAPPGLTLPAGHVRCAPAAETSTPTPPASPHTTPRGVVPASSSSMPDDSTDSSAEAPSDLAPIPGFQIGQMPLPLVEEEPPLWRPWESPSTIAQADPQPSEIESVDLDADASTVDPREHQGPLGMGGHATCATLDLPPAFTPNCWYHGAPIGDWPAWAEIPGQLYLDHDFLKPLTCVIAPDSCVREQVTQVTIMLAHLQDAWTDAFMDPWLIAACAASDVYEADRQDHCPFAYVTAPKIPGPRNPPAATEHQIRLIIDCAAQQDVVLAGILILMISYGMTVRAAWLCVCSHRREGLPTLALEATVEGELPAGYSPIIPPLTWHAEVVSKALKRRPVFPGITGQAQLEASLQTVLETLSCDCGRLTLRIEDFTSLALFWHMHYGRITRRDAVRIACGITTPDVEYAAWLPLEAAVGKLIAQQALVCPNFDDAPVAVLPEEYMPLFRRVPQNHSVTLWQQPDSLQQAEDMIHVAHNMHVAFLHIEVDTLVRAGRYDSAMDDDVLELLEKLTDQCLLRGAPPQLYEGINRCLHCLWHGNDPYHVQERAWALYQQLNDLVADRARWLAADTPLPPTGHIILDMETRFADTYPQVVLAVVLAWHYGVSLHWALLLSRFSFRRGSSESGADDTTIVFVAQQERPPFSAIPEPAVRLLHSVLSARSRACSDVALIPIHAPMLEELFEALFARIAMPHGCHALPSLQQLHGLAIANTTTSYGRFDQHVRSLRRTFDSHSGARQGLLGDRIDA